MPQLISRKVTPWLKRLYRPMSPSCPWRRRIRCRIGDQLRAVRSLIDGFQELLDAGGPVTRLVLGPKWLLPTVVLIASPQGARDILGRTDEVADRGQDRTTAIQLRHADGRQPARPAARALAAAAARAAADVHQTAASALRRAHGRGRADASSTVGATVPRRPRHRMPQADAAGARPLGARARPRRPRRRDRPTLRPPLAWIADRAARPVNLPQWVPTPASARPAAATTTLHRLAAEILQAVRDDPTGTRRWCAP